MRCAAEAAPEVPAERGREGSETRGPPIGRGCGGGGAPLSAPPPSRCHLAGASVEGAQHTILLDPAGGSRGSIQEAGDAQVTSPAPRRIWGWGPSVFHPSRVKGQTSESPGLAPATEAPWALRRVGSDILSAPVARRPRFAPDLGRFTPASIGTLLGPCRPSVHVLIGCHPRFPGTSRIMPIAAMRGRRKFIDAGERLPRRGVLRSLNTSGCAGEETWAKGVGF